MWKNLTFSWPAVGATAVFTSAVLGGYTYYVHAVVIPTEDLAEQQRALAVQVRDEAVQRDVEAAGNAILNSMALLQTTQAMTPMATSGGASDSAVATAFGEPGPAVQPAALPTAPAPAPAPPMGDYAYASPPSPPPPVYTPPPEPEPRTSGSPSTEESPGIVTVTVAPPLPLSETMPQVLTEGYYWEPGYWNYNRGQGRFNWTRGQLKQKPAAFISSSSQFVPTQWVTRNGAYVLVPGYWVNQTNPYAGNTMPGAASLIQLPTSTFPRPPGATRGGGGG
jgi:hypothetical protein